MDVQVIAERNILPSRLRRLANRPLLVVVACAAVFVVPSLLHWAVTGRLVLGDFLDVTVYRAGAVAVTHGRPLYETDLPALSGDYPFTYTPFAALLFAPMALVPAWVCRALVIPVHVALLAAVVRSCLRTVDDVPAESRRRAVVVVTALLLLVEPITWTMWLGQINLVLLALVLWDEFGRRRWSGVGIGIAASIKLTPALFIVFLLCVRRFRAAGTALVTAGIATGLGFAFLPSDSLRYWGGTFLDNSRFGATDGAENLSINGMLARLLGEGPVERVLWTLLAAAVAVCGLFLATRVYRQGNRLLGLTVCGLTTAAVSPFSWSHHWIWLGVLALLAIVHASRIQLVCLAALIFAWPVHVLFGLHIPFPVLGSSAFPPWLGLEVVYGNAYLIVFAGVLLSIARRRVPLCRDGACPG